MTHSSAEHQDHAALKKGVSGRFLTLPASTFAITLQSSLRPIDVNGLPDLEVFREHPLYVTRATEDGQVRYRLRLGTFIEARSANRIAITVREQFPAALSSQLSDCERRNSAAVRRLASSIQLRRHPSRTVARQTSSTNRHAVKPEGSLLRPDLKEAKITPRSGHINAVHSLNNGFEKSQKSPSQDPVCAYALNLHWSWHPITSEQLLKLPVLYEHHLYNVKVKRDGAVWYGLRLGFFSTRSKAKRIALSLQPYFRSVRVVATQASEFRSSAGSQVSPPRRISQGWHDASVGAESRRSPLPVSHTDTANARASERTSKVESSGSASQDAVVRPTPLPPSAQRIEPAAASKEYRVIRPSALLCYLLVAAALFLGWQNLG